MWYLEKLRLGDKLGSWLLLESNDGSLNWESGSKVTVAQGKWAGSDWFDLGLEVGDEGRLKDDNPVF